MPCNTALYAIVFIIFLHYFIIASQEVMKETMEVRLPLIKEIVDHYSGPDRVTAKQQHEELKRVAGTLPQSAPASVKLFTERAVQSLQVNFYPCNSLLSFNLSLKMEYSPTAIWPYFNIMLKWHLLVISLKINVEN